MMAKNTSGLSANNVFKPATTTTQAAEILSGQLTAYEGLMRAIQSPNMLEALRMNDLTQTMNILDALAKQLQAWMGAPNV